MPEPERPLTEAELETHLNGLWRWLYAAFLLTLGLSSFTMLWWRNERDFILNRVTAVEARLDARDLVIEGRQHEDVKTLNDKLDGVRSQLAQIYVQLLSEQQKHQP